VKNTLKELLIDLVEYHRTLKYAKDAGHVRLQYLAHRAVQELDKEKAQRDKKASDVDPFAMDVVNDISPQLPLNLKHENEW
jgi:hypothetical protein